ncbi:hypothetical protein WICPIJ_007817 [Wickerhamomyces pijperi]|uniref:Secreted protein n=1 Tax=Wickerhamomyces pijperi TaxID=599730 RepID=A0A9P8Q1R0_WICPI|nr:hypothetical protein WICPIJ_007817 [Wickerhamomyces pijperi]
MFISTPRGSVSALALFLDLLLLLLNGAATELFLLLETPPTGRISSSDESESTPPVNWLEVTLLELERL